MGGAASREAAPADAARQRAHRDSSARGPTRTTSPRSRPRPRCAVAAVGRSDRSSRQPLIQVGAAIGHARAELYVRRADALAPPVRERRRAAKHEQRRIAGKVEPLVIEHLIASGCVSEGKYADGGHSPFPAVVPRVSRRSPVITAPVRGTAEEPERQPSVDYRNNGSAWTPASAGNQPQQARQMPAVLARALRITHQPYNRKRPRCRGAGLQTKRLVLVSPNALHRTPDAR